MPPLRDFLTRFRPAGSPGAAAGVPADRSGELESEVAPVLALLDNTEAECERLIRQARREAEQVVAAARSEAGAIAADAAQRAETAREQATRLAMTAAREQAARTGEPGTAGKAARRLRHADRPATDAVLSASPLDFDAVEEADRYELLAGEVQLETFADSAVRRSGASALAGWIPADRLAAVAASVAEIGGAVVRLRTRPASSLPRW